MVLSASSVASLTDYGSPWYFFVRQLHVDGRSASARSCSRSRIDYRGWRDARAPAARSSACVLLVVVLVPGIGIYVVGLAALARAPASFRFQPQRDRQARAAALRRRPREPARRRARTTGGAVVQPGRRWCSPCSRCLVMKEPDLGSTMVLALIVVAVLVVGGVPAAPPRGDRRASAIAAVTLLAHRRAVPAGPHAHVPRTRSPTRRTRATRSRSRSSRSAAAGSTGVGLGAGRAKWNFLPNAHTDFIFAIIGEELGSSAACSCSALFVALRACSASAPRCARPTGSACCSPAGITVWIVGQAVINIGAVVGLLPVTGHPAAVRVVRRLRARHHDARGRHPRQHRPPGSRRRPPRDAARCRRDGDRDRRPDQRRRHRRSRLSRARARRGARRPRARAATRSASSARSAGSRRPRCPRPASRSTCCPGAGCSQRGRRRALAQNLRTAWDTVVAVARALAARAPAPPARRRRRRRLRVAARRWSAAAAAAASRRSCTRPTPIPGSPTGSRCASVPAPAVSLPGTPLPRRGGHRQPGPARDRRGARGRRSTPPLVAVVGGSLGARSHEPTRRSASTTAGGDRDDVAVHHVTRRPRLRRVPQPARRRCARPGDALGYDSSRYEEHMEAVYTDATLVVCPLGRDDRRAHRGRHARRCSCRCPGAPGDHQTAQRRGARPRPAPR